VAHSFSILLQAKERFPRILMEKRGPPRKRALDAEDPDPYVHWTDLKMGRTHTPRPGNFSSKDSGSDDEVVILEVLSFFTSSLVIFL
jgi:hypothetical protein